MHVMIITPIFYPAQGGASTYYNLLSKKLVESDKVKRVTILTERFPGTDARETLSGGAIRVIRYFPFRAGGKINSISKYIRYAVQNLQYLAIPGMIRKLSPDVVMIHSSFHNVMNLLQLIVPLVARNVKVVSDVRDHQLPEKSLTQLAVYDRIIACSENVVAHLQKRPELMPRVLHIPVIQEQLAITDARATLAKYELEAQQYILYAGLIKQKKGLEILLNTYQKLRERGLRLSLLLVGLIRDRNLVRLSDRIPGVRILEPLPRDELLHLMKHAAINVSLSLSEGMGRVSLEAIALSSRVLLPQGIPEFDRYCPNMVARSLDPDQLADQIEALLSVEVGNAYPIKIHDPQTIVASYLNMFDDLQEEKAEQQSGPP